MFGFTLHTKWLFANFSTILKILYKIGLTALLSGLTGCDTETFTDSRTYTTRPGGKDTTKENLDAGKKGELEPEPEPEPEEPTPEELQLAAIDKGKADGKVFYDGCVAACHVANPAVDANISNKTVASVAMTMSINHFGIDIAAPNQLIIKAYVYGALNFNDAVEDLYPIADFE